MRARPENARTADAESVGAGACGGIEAVAGAHIESADAEPACAGAAERVHGARVLIACAMMEDEVHAALAHCGAELPIIWVDRGYHEKPDVLRAKLQECIREAEAQGASEVLLAFGLCGNAAVGLKTRSATLAMPRFDDCVNAMLRTGPRTRRGDAKAGIMYLTRGWAHDRSLVTGQYERYVRKYGKRRADIVMKGMYGAYRGVSLIDDGCYDIEGVRGYARSCADALGVDVYVDAGSNQVLEKLVYGTWDDDILVRRPGVAVAQEDFDFVGSA